MADLWRLAGSELAALVAKKQASCAEVVESHLRRIEAVNPKVNAIVRVLADQARKDAAEADRKIAAGRPLGPLHGVPFTIKENIDFAGTATTWGVKALANAVVPLDAPVFEAAAAASPALDAAGMSRVFANRHGVARAWSQFMAEHPLILSPTWTRLPLRGWFRHRVCRNRRCDDGSDSTGPPRQSSRPALGLRAGRPRLRDWIADRGLDHGASVARRRKP